MKFVTLCYIAAVITATSASAQTSTPSTGTEWNGDPQLQEVAVTVGDAPARKWIDVRSGQWYRVEASAAPAQSELQISWFDGAGALLSVDVAASFDGRAAFEGRAPDGARQALLVLRGPPGGVWEGVRVRDLPRFEDLGSQVFKLRHRNGVFSDGHLFVVSDRVSRLAVIDVSSGEQKHLVDLKHSVGLDNLLHSSGYVYLGIKGLARVHPDTWDVEYLDLPLSGGVRDLVESPDGVVWGAIHPEGAVFSYDPSTGTYWESDQLIEGFKYANGLAYHDGKLLVGIGSPARLLVFDPATGEKQQILPARFMDQSHVRPPHLYGNRLLLKLDTSREGLVLDADTKEEIVHLDQVSSHSFSTPDDGNRVYFTGNDRLWTFDLDTDEVHVVESDHVFATAADFGWVEIDDDAFPGTSLAATEPNGSWWVWNPTTDQFRRLKTDMPGVNYQTHNLLLGGDGDIWGVGYIGAGGFRLDASRGFERYDVAVPQIEGMVAIRDTIYMGVYPKARFIRQNVFEAWAPEPMFSLEGQNRPFAALAQDEKYFFGSIPLRGTLGGVFGVYDPATGQHRAWRNLSPDQAITSVAVNRNRAYLGTSRSGGLSSVPTTSEGRLLVFNLRTETVEHSVVPVDGEQAVGALTWGPDGRIWGITKGWLFAYDPSTNEVAETWQFDETVGWNPPDHNWGYGESLFFSEDGFLYGTNSRSFFRIRTATREVEVLFEGKASHPIEDLDGRIWFIGGPEKHLMRFNR